MTEQPLKKNCNICKKDLPATEEFFFPSYLEPGGKNTCKTCHKEQARNSRSASYRVQLQAKAIPITSEQVPLYKSLNSIATATGLSTAVVEHDIFDRNLPVYSFIYNNVGPALALPMEAAQAYIQEHTQNGHIPTDPPSSPVKLLPTHTDPLPTPEILGNPDMCGSCKQEKGNILAVYTPEQQIIAYLCAACYRAARSFDWEPERLRAVAKLIEMIGGNIDRSRR